MNRVITSYGPEVRYDKDDEHLKEINLSRSATNPNWLYEKMTEGLITETNMQEILSMAGLLENYYPELWDIQVGNLQYTYDISFKNETGYGLEEFTEKRKINKLYFKIIVRYPELTMKNSKGVKHDIKDLYIYTLYAPDVGETIRYTQLDRESKLVDYPELITYGGLYAKFRPMRIYNLKGWRGKVSVYEYSHNYGHSHLSNGTGYPTNGTFCLGSGDIVVTLGTLNAGYNPELFSMLLFQMGVYAKWESLEGGPYQRIDSINTGGRLNKLPNVNPTNHFRDIKGFLQEHPENIPQLTWKSDNGLLKIVEDDKFEKFLRPYANNPTRYNSSTIYFQDNDGNLYGSTAISTPTIPSGITNKKFIFRGEEKGLEVYIPERSEININFLIHPEVRKYIKTKLETYANYQRIKRSISDRANSIANSSRVIR